MSFGKAPKIFAITLSVLVVVLIATAQVLTMHIKGVLKAELSERLPSITEKLGISLKYDDVSFNWFTGPSLQGVSIASISLHNKSPFMSVESIRLLYSLHLKPAFHVRIDGVRLMRPNIQIVINDEDSTPYPQILVGLFEAEGLGAGTANDADARVELSQQLKLLWQEGELRTSGMMMLGLSGNITYDRRSADITFETAARLTLNHWRLADREIRDIDFALSGNLQFDAAAQRIQFDRLNIDTNGFVLTASGSAEFLDSFKLDTFIESDRVPIQKALNAVPKDFAPALEGAEVDGTIKLGMGFGIDTANLKALKFEPNIEIDGFQLLKASNDVDIEKLKGPFMHQAKKKGEVVKEFLVGQPTYRFVPYQRLGKNTKKGVLTCEDGSFFRHNGFRVDHFRESLIQDIREKRFARGASTITMQTAKNLFLTGDKNLSRKFQEILIAYALEQMLTKERILEIYMNIIEWGHKIYGIGSASKHYFSKWPKDLDPLEAAFLGSIIATPVRSHHMYSRGSVTDQWATFLALIVSKMGINGNEYAELEPFEPEFDWVKKKRLAEEKKHLAEKEKRKVKKTRRLRFRRRR